MRKDILSEEVTRFYIAETVLALESIHCRNYIHRWEGKLRNTASGRPRATNHAQQGSGKTLALAGQAWLRCCHVTSSLEIRTGCWRARQHIQACILMRRAAGGQRHAGEAHGWRAGVAFAHEHAWTNMLGRIAGT